jgi:tetratricopeptide (TPR) repeat protein
VARGTQHRKRRPAQNARTAAVAAGRPRKERPPQWQEQLFFQRLRVHAKWAFVFLALVFAVGFVIFGVGSGSTGVSDALQNAFNFGGGGGTSISKLQGKVNKNPADAQAWRDLATAYETKHDQQNAVDALERYVGLRPRDQDALLDLAGQYQLLAQKYADDYNNAQTESALLQTPATAFPLPTTTGLGKAFNDPKGLQDPLTAAARTVVSEKGNTALTGYRTASENAEKTYQRLAKVSPKDASTQILLARAAEAIGDSKTAIAAYKDFLRLAPDDPSAGSVKTRLKSLEKSAKSSGTQSSTSG